MSTDKQDLSPSTQKEAIAAYAAARSLEIVASYEDEGRSGVHLNNRPGLLRLLQDLTSSKEFASVLVYDASRWGRFQDTDAAAYYEYHCRLHGDRRHLRRGDVRGDVSPIAAMLKSIKRAMAAEYSRDLATKTRAGQHQVISRGYQESSRSQTSATGRKQPLLETRRLRGCT
jgi:DNA invertase Pin-like site-specific DNA recombinase